MSTKRPKKAYFIKDGGEGFRGDAKLYRLSHLIRDESNGEKYRHVIVSAVNVIFDGPETFIFGANEDGVILSYSELGGSYRGGLDHILALSQAGYEVV